MIIYIDINYETKTEQFEEFETNLKKVGLLVAKSEYWTRYNSAGNNSNIDIIVYSSKLQNSINVHFSEFVTISDHV